MNAVAQAVADSWVIAERNLIKVRRMPELLVFVLITPIMFVLLFGFVFGGAIDPGGAVDYREWLMAGVFAQTVVFGATFTGAGVAEDMEKGIIGRFRSLPMSRSAVLVGRTTSDLVNSVLSLVVMSLTGLLIGWRVRNGVLDALLAMLLLLAFSYAMTWVMVYVALVVHNVEVINNATFLVVMPLTFVSNAFVPTDSFHGVLRTIVEWNPVSTLAQAARELFGNTGGVAAPDSWPMQHPSLYTSAWAVLIVAVFLPLAIRHYRRMDRI